VRGVWRPLRVPREVDAVLDKVGKPILYLIVEIGPIFFEVVFSFKDVRVLGGFFQRLVRVVVAVLGP